ncbi:MAG: trypsin-like peptidase domain-containing protein [Clostridia bacterium]|nr:trypsin-like peptidase domain-containing protein [Clostridia bacterium]
MFFKTKNPEAKRTKLVSLILAVSMMMCLVFGMAFSANAAEVGQAVTEAKNGVVQVQVWFKDPETATEVPLHYGTGFLVNDTTVVTCQHVANGFPDEWYVNWAKLTNAENSTNRTAAQIKDMLELRVMLYRGTYVKAKLTNANPELDLAVLTLSQQIARTPLAIRNSDELKQTDEVFAIGYPSDLVSIDSKNTYDIDDITISSGNVNKVGDVEFDAYDDNYEVHEYKDVNCVVNSALITGGNSGGPLVDKDGNVVGVNAAGDGSRFMAISSKELITYLTALNISFAGPGPIKTTTADTTTTTTGATLNTSELSSLITKAEGYAAQDYTEESYKAMKAALKDAKAALTADSQATIDNAAEALDEAIDALAKEEQKSAMNQYVMIGIIAVVAIAVIVVVIILIVSMNKKKAQPAPVAAPVAPVAPVAAKPVAAPAPVAAVKPVAAPAKPAAPSAGETTVLSQSAGETTVLSQSAGETTVLSQNVNGGALVRSSNNERIPICSAEFTVGRERSSVDYCVGGNTNISRVHARFVVRDGVTYIVDNKAANGTFVNGVKARAGQEVELKDGDKILLADEKFEYKK